MISFDDLVIAIEELEAKKIISFDEFKVLPFHEIHKRFFAMPHPTTMRKAIAKIQDKRDGKEGLSEVSSTTEHYVNGELKKVVTRTHRF
jgi:hypothetical protein